jgi:hypothetical protein
MTYLHYLDTLLAELLVHIGNLRNERAALGEKYVFTRFDISHHPRRIRDIPLLGAPMDRRPRPVRPVRDHRVRAVLLCSE